MSNILNLQQRTNLKSCGQKLAAALAEVIDAVVLGISTLQLDEIAEKALRKRDCTPSFRGYYVAGAGEFPNTICVSINNEIVHGVPSRSRIIKDGDLVSIDIGAAFKGIYADMATTVAVGNITAEAKKLIDITKQSLKIGISQAHVGNTIGDIGAEIEKNVKKHKFGLIRDYVGHGIGTEPHMTPQIPNFGVHGTGSKIVNGMALAIEPMTTLGGDETTLSSDRWTVKTADGSLAAHFEHTILIENGKPIVVTK